jgi:peptidoglycan-associated lipoprotein
MQNRKLNSCVGIAALAVLTFLLGCGSKKVAKIMEPAPPPPAAPTVSPAATPSPVNPVAENVATPEPSDADLFARNVKDVYFNFDDARIRGEEVPVTHNNSSFLNQRSNLKVLIEGHCDERGSSMYNLALGTKRAEAVKEALVQQGVDPSRIKTISYGKEKPFCTQESEDCWQQNRRDHFVLQH